MTDKKTVFIIPGYKHKPKNKAYKVIAHMFKKEGYYPIPIAISWKQTTISENTEYFIKQYKKIRRRKKYIFGFSFGAMIAFLASTKIKTSGLILCSLSPYFTEDRPSSPLRCATLARQIKAKKILMLYGAKESRTLIKRVRKAYSQISSTHKYLIPIKETEHNIADRRYLHKIHQVARGLN